VIAAGCELEKMSEDMSVALPILTKNEKLLRGLNIWLFPGFLSVFRIVFFGLPDPDPLVRVMDPDPDPSIIM
jgi:hypothetical protein